LATTSKKKEETVELREFKFVVQPVLLRLKDGKPDGELPADPMTFYCLDGVREFIKRFPVDLASLNETAAP